MESSMTRYFASCGTGWKRDAERLSMWLGWAQVRKTQTVDMLWSFKLFVIFLGFFGLYKLNLFEQFVKPIAGFTCQIVYLPLVLHPPPTLCCRWWWLGSGWEGYGGLNSHGALYVWATGCWPYSAPGAQWGCWFGTRLPDPPACGWAGLPGGQVSGQRAE